MLIIGSVAGNYVYMFQASTVTGASLTTGRGAYTYVLRRAFLSHDYPATNVCCDNDEEALPHRGKYCN